MIPFNKPFLTGKEKVYLNEVLEAGKFSGNGPFAQKCSAFFRDHFGFTDNYLTTSCTDALEMSALLCNIQPGDEVILPSYTFVSTANAFLLRGANLVFADSNPTHPNISAAHLSTLITPKTKAVVIVHYAGMACDMEAIQNILAGKNIFLIEDAAQGVDSYYNSQPLGSLGDFGAFSFHETKNIQCGEGGLLAVNNKKFSERAAVIWEKGTDRAAFLQGKVSEYGWKDIGSSFYPSELNAAFLFAQLEAYKNITTKRISDWSYYDTLLKNIKDSGTFSFPVIESYMHHNAHHYFFSCSNKKQRDALIMFLQEKEIRATFHYLPLHQSEYFSQQQQQITLPNAERFGDTLIRLPLFNSITKTEIEKTVSAIHDFIRE